MGLTALICISVAFSAPDLRLEPVKTELVERFGFSRMQVDSLFADPRLQAYPRESFPRKRIDWERFTRDVLSRSSIRAGREFIAAHRAVFEEEERQFGIDSEDIVSLLRVETDFGKTPGAFQVINVFYTRLLRPNGKGWKWAADNLIAFSVYCLIYELDCYEIYGSHAGAFGLPQFLPTTLVEFGVDADGDGRENLSSIADAVMSAAKYLNELGWQEDRTRALALYYGSSRGYPDAVERYALAVGKLE